MSEGADSRPVSQARVAICHPVLTGHQAVAGLWFPADWWDEAGRARRLLAHWVPGAAAWRFTQGDLLCWPQPVTQSCEDLAGWPLCRAAGVQGSLCSAALSEAERAALPVADAWIVTGGQVLALSLAQASPLDPADWLALDDVPVLVPDDLGFEAAEAVLLTPPVRSVREVVGDAVGPASTAQQDFVRAMAQRAASAEGAAPTESSRPTPPATGRGPGAWLQVLSVLVVLATLVSWVSQAWSASGVDAAKVLWLLALGVALLGLVAWLMRRARSAAGRAVEGLAARLREAPRAEAEADAVSAASAEAASGAPGQGRRPPARGLRPRRDLAQWVPPRWRDWLLRLAISLPVGRWLGRQQAAYLRRMLALFDEGDLEQALRHAIPLSDGDVPSAGAVLGVPRPRRELHLSEGGGASASLPLGPDLHTHLRRLYRRTFERLDREKRIDEALFVLAELLQDRQHALDYLETQGRHAQAAALALAWDRPADEIVRLHALAGDWRMAVAVARRDRAFAGAVRQLAPRWPEAARRLREAWADALVQQGDWMGAVEAVWPDASLRERAGAWLDEAQRAGGHLAAQALVKRAVLMPQSWRDDTGLLRALRDDPAWRPQRAALAEALLAERGGADTGALAALAALLVPSVLADQASKPQGFNQLMLQRLVSLTGDKMLQADLPRGGWPVAQPQALWKRGEPLACAAPEAGSLAVFDAVPLEAPGYLLALGEAGVQVVDAAGRPLVRFERPAHRLVLSHNRRVALLLAARGELWRVSRVDLQMRSVVDLGLCELTHFADTFDGIAWTVVRGGEVLVLDATRALNEVLWRVGGLPGPVALLAAGLHQEQLLIGAELWRYQLPGRRLSAREPLPPLSAGQVRVLHPHHGVVDVGREAAPQPGVVGLSWRWGNACQGRLAWDEGEPQGLRVLAGGHGLLLACRRADGGSVVRWVQMGGRLDAQVDWPGGHEPRIRVMPQGDALFFDEAGRCLHLDAQTGEVLRFTVR